MADLEPFVGADAGVAHQAIGGQHHTRGPWVGGRHAQRRELGDKRRATCGAVGLGHRVGHGAAVGARRGVGAAIEGGGNRCDDLAGRACQGP